MPATGLTFKFKADPNVARRAIALRTYWAGDVTLGGISIGQDDYAKARR